LNTRNGVFTTLHEKQCCVVKFTEASYQFRSLQHEHNKNQNCTPILKNSERLIQYI